MLPACGDFVGQEPCLLPTLGGAQAETCAPYRTAQPVNRISSHLSPSASIGGEAVPFGLYLHFPLGVSGAGSRNHYSLAAPE